MMIHTNVLTFDLHISTQDLFLQNLPRESSPKKLYSSQSLVWIPVARRGLKSFYGQFRWVYRAHDYTFITYRYTCITFFVFVDDARRADKRV